MDLYFLGLKDLDRPVHKVDNYTLFNCQPFFDDYYVVVYLKKVYKPQVGYKPVIINDKDLIMNYGANNLPSLISQIVAVGEQTRSYTYKLVYRILVLRNGWWCVYIEKRHIWDPFESKGVITIMSPNCTEVLEFFQKHFVPKLLKQGSKFNPNRKRLIAPVTPPTNIGTYFM